MNKYFLKYENTSTENNFSSKWTKEELEEDTLSQLQRLVGGYIDHVTWLFPELTKNNIDVWIDDEGLLKERKPNVVVFDEEDDNKIISGIVGPIVFAKYDQEGETLGLTEKDILKIKKYIGDTCYLWRGMIAKSKQSIVNEDNRR